MKKTLLATLLATFVLSASALELGVNASSDRNDADHKDAGVGLTLGEHFDKVSVTGGFDYYEKKDTYKTSLVAGYDVAKFGPVTLTAKAGGVYIDQEVNDTNTVKNSGLAGVYGAGASFALAKELALTADYRYQVGNDTVKQYNGSTYTAGIKVSF
jgi:opacity protein-like surface antigen